MICTGLDAINKLVVGLPAESLLHNNSREVVQIASIIWHQSKVLMVCDSEGKHGTYVWCCIFFPILHKCFLMFSFFYDINIVDTGYFIYCRVMMIAINIIY